MIRLCALIFFIASFYQVCSQPSIVWTFKTGGKVYSSPTLDGDILYVGSEDGNLYAINLSDGKERWRFRTGGMVHSSPLVAENSVIVNSHDGNLYCLDGRNGKLIWKFQTGGERIYDMWDYYLSSPIDYHGTIFFGSGDSHIYALNRTDGRLKWKYKTEDIVHATPAVADGFVYVGSFDGNLYALNAATGALKWRFKTDGYIKNHASVFTDGGHFKEGFELYGSDMIQSENTILSLGSILSTPVISNGVIYFGSADGNIYAVRL